MALADWQWSLRRAAALRTIWSRRSRYRRLVSWKLVPIIYREFNSPLKHIPGPANESWFRGNGRAIDQEDHAVPQERWVKEANSKTITYKAFLGVGRLWTMDLRAVNHVLTHSNVYQKPVQQRGALIQIIGNGVLATEGETHRKQRRIMNPAFGPAQIRELTGIFVDKSNELRDVWAREIDAADGQSARLDVLSWLSRMTLDVIGLAGFNYKFDSLNPRDGEPNELSKAFSTIFSPSGVTMLQILRFIFPVLRHFPDARMREANNAQAVMRRIGLELIAEKKAAIRRETAEGKAEKDGVARSDVRGRDLLTLLLKANMATDIPDSQRLTDDEVVDQVPTFLVAGHETTSTSTTWALFALALAPAIQDKLRAELLAVPTDTPSMDELAALPYLDMVVRETLRVHAPVPTIFREAQEDDVIPLAEPFVDRAGVARTSVRVTKGTPVVVPVLAINRSTELWGADAFAFRPERWASVPEGVSGVPGVWAHIMSFIGGPRACIGYRFSLIEMKALLFALIRAFEFELAVPAESIQKKSAIVQRPIIQGEPEKGSQMPMIIRRVKRV
ncbi:cytochrome P450 [Epithele typhae]|uniref:cytochrome P450 n=1 Tax=Epithele typhae TaxID=378194 RepID=UPI002008B08B|nr:cytochrome P450 [Epithele typhae]KAH9919442.1 cytochrome P450 [Epithele typhae]